MSTDRNPMAKGEAALKASVCDLKSLGSALRGEPRHRQLVRDLDRALLAQSCAADLGVAQQCLDILQGDMLQPDQRPGTDFNLQQSLLLNAVIFYARATTGSAKDGGRGSSQVRDALSATSRIDHDAVIEYRNRAVAHVHVGHSLDDWHENHLFMIKGEDDYWEIGSATRMNSYSRKAMEHLMRIIGPAMEVLLARFQDAGARVGAALATASPPIDLSPHLVEPTEFFGDADIASRVLGTRGSTRLKVFFLQRSA